MPFVVASAGGSGGAGRASSHRASRPDARRRRGRATAVPERLLRSVAAWGAGLLSLAGGTLALRRLAGALAAPQGATALVAATAIGIGLVALADRLRTREFGPRFAGRLGLALAMAALVPPLKGSGMGAGTLAGTMLAILAGSVVLLLPLRDAGIRSRTGSPFRPRSDDRRRRAGPRQRRRERPAASPAAAGAAALPTPEISAPIAVAAAPPPPPTVPVPPAPPPFPPAEAGTLVLQRFERVLDPAERAETIRGTILLRVAAGSRAAIGHVGFCPPFPQFPRVEVGTTCEEVEATVVAAEVLPWGVRVECRLDEAADESIDVPVDVVARSPLPGDPPDGVPS